MDKASSEPSLVENFLELEEELKEGAVAHRLISVQDGMITPHAAEADARRAVIRVDRSHVTRPMLKSFMRRIFGVDEGFSAPGNLPIGHIPETEGNDMALKTLRLQFDDQIQRLTALGLDDGK